MNFLQKINKLKQKYSYNDYEFRDSAILYGIYQTTPPLSAHIIYEPMPKNVMDNMVKNYVLSFPKELLTLYKTMNGADLFWSYRSIGKKQIRIAYNHLSIYGIPLVGDREHIEPYNISVEDLNRPAGTPTKWLKFGTYYTKNNIDTRYDLYVDTTEHCVFSVENGIQKLSISEKWDSIDECLCIIFDMLWENEERLTNY